jgi:hypothetical protein
MVLCILAYDGHCVMVLQVAAQKYEGNMVLLSSTTHKRYQGGSYSNRDLHIKTYKETCIGTVQLSVQYKEVARRNQLLRALLGSDIDSRSVLYHFTWRSSPTLFQAAPIPLDSRYLRAIPPLFASICTWGTYLGMVHMKWAFLSHSLPARPLTHFSALTIKLLQLHFSITFLYLDLTIPFWQKNEGVRVTYYR